MKKYLRYILPVCLAGSLCTSCTDFFETDSDGVLKTEGQRYQDETTARAGLFGLLQGLQRRTLPRNCATSAVSRWMRKIPI